MQSLIVPGPLDGFIMAWLSEKVGRTGSAKTKAAYQDTLQSFRVALSSVGLDLLDDPVKVRLVAQGWATNRSADSRRSGDVASTTYNQRLAIVSSFYAYCLRNDLIEGINPLDKVVRRPVQDYAGAYPMEADEIAQKLKAIDRSTLVGCRDYAFLMLAHHTGRRISELREMRWGDIRLVGKRVVVHFPHCKGGKSASNELSPAVKKALFDYLHRRHGSDLGTLSNETPIWPSLSRNAANSESPMSIQALSDLYKRCLGVSTTHVSRHSFAHQLDLLNVPLSEIGDALLHSDLSTTSTYLKSMRSTDSKHARKLEQAFGVALDESEE